MLDGKYGEGVKRSLVGEANFSGSGSTNGHRSYFEIARDKKYGYVILSNSAGVFDMISQGLTEILQGRELTVKSFTIPRAIPNPNKNLSEFLGQYKRSDGSATEVVLRNGYLYSSDIKLIQRSSIVFSSIVSLAKPVSSATRQARSKRSSGRATIST